MSIRRHFLGVEVPALVSTAEYICQRYAQAGILDLESLLVVTPGARAGRRLNALLCLAAKDRQLRYLPPEITTEGRVPELLYQPKWPFASEWVQQLCWAKAIRNVDADARRSVFPRIPAAATSNGSGRWTESEWLALGKLLMTTYRELAGEALTFANVADSHLSSFPERSRWISMAIIQEEYLRQLRERELWDRQTARIVAVEHRECSIDRDILLVATADLTDTLRKMLHQVPDRVTALIHAPQSWADRFDDDGCLIATAWQSVPIDIPKNRVEISETFADQARAVVKRLAQLDDKFACDQISIGCPDDRMLAPLQRALAAYGINARWGPGRSIRESGPFRLLDALRRWITTDDIGAFADVIRHPDVETWLYSKGVYTGWINDLDAYRAEHLPNSIDGNWLGEKEKYGRLKSAWHHLQRLSRQLHGQPRTLPEWSLQVADLLGELYQAQTWDSGSPHDRMLVAAANEFRELFRQQMAIPADLSEKISAAEALELMLEFVADKSIAAASDPAAIELLGWLELPLDDAPVSMLTGINEGVVPRSGSADLFLPDSLRRDLEIEDNVHRYAREAYALSVILASRPEVHLIVGRRDQDGEPLVPSRLLFAGDDETVCQRWRDLFGLDSYIPEEQLPEAPAITATRTFRFDLPRPVILPVPPITRMSVTSFGQYLNCPYQFYLSHVLKLRAFTAAPSELDGRTFGNVLHAVMESFGKGEFKDSVDTDQIAAELQRLLRAEMESRFGAEPSPAVRLQKKHMERRLVNFARFQAQHAADGWLIEAVEVDHDQAQITVSEGSITLSGKIDRIDRHRETGERLILDYKTGEQVKDPEQAHRRNKSQWYNLQLPLYLEIAKDMGLRDVIDLGFVLISRKNDKQILQRAGWTDRELNEAIKVAHEVVSKVLSQEFWPPNSSPISPFNDYSQLMMLNVQERPGFHSA